MGRALLKQEQPECDSHSCSEMRVERKFHSSDLFHLCSLLRNKMLTSILQIFVPKHGGKRGFFLHCNVYLFDFFDQTLFAQAKCNVSKIFNFSGIKSKKMETRIVLYPQFGAILASFVHNFQTNKARNVIKASGARIGGSWTKNGA